MDFKCKEEEWNGDKVSLKKAKENFSVTNREKKQGTNQDETSKEHGEWESVYPPCLCFGSYPYGSYPYQS